jgi:hypothetical protein
MNKHFKKWITKVVGETDGEFTSAMILQKIISEKTTSAHIGTTSAIGWFLARMPNVEKIKDARGRIVWRVKDED